MPRLGESAVTAIQVVSSTAVFVGAAAVASAFGAPVLLALGVAGVASGAAGAAIANAFAGREQDPLRLLAAGVLSGAITVATAGLSSLAAPLLARAGASVLGTPGQAAAASLTRTAAGRAAANAAVGAALGASVQAGENALAGRPLGSGVAVATAAGALGGAVLEPAQAFVGDPIARLLGHLGETVPPGGSPAAAAGPAAPERGAAQAIDPTQALGSPEPAAPLDPAAASLLRIATTKPSYFDLAPGTGARAREAVARLEPAQLDRLRGALTAAGSDLERTYLLRALAANEPVGNVEWLASQIRGKPLPWLLENLSLTDPLTDSRALVQAYDMSCAPTVLQALRGEVDPVYALRTRLANQDLHAVDDFEPGRVNPHEAEVQRRLLESARTSPDDPSGPGKAVARGLSSGGQGQGRSIGALLDWLNGQSQRTGAVYDPIQVLWADGVPDALAARLADGLPVPAAFAKDDFGHVVLFTHVRTAPGGGREFRVFDPAYGTSSWWSAEDVVRDRMNLGGAEGVRLSALFLPRPAGSEPVAPPPGTVDARALAAAAAPPPAVSGPLGGW